MTVERPKTIEQKKYTKEQIREKLHLFHGTTKEKWDKMRKIGALLSEEELIKRGIITDAEKEEFTSTGSLDRAVGNDKFVFLATNDANYGDVVLEIDPEVLNLKNSVVNTAGDFLNFVNNPELSNYYKASQIPANQFIDYLYKFINNLSVPEWFFEKSASSLKKFLGDALLEKTRQNKYDKYKIFWALHPEIKIPNEIPLKFIKKINYKDE